MKKLYIVLIILTVVLTGCSSNSKTGTANNKNGSTVANNSNSKGLVQQAADDISKGARNIGNEVKNVADDVGNNIEKAKQNESQSSQNSNSSNSDENKTNSDLSVKASNIANNLNKINGVQKATVIMVGDTALIGLNLNDNLGNDKVTAIKREVSTKTKNLESGVTTTFITASPDLVQRINNLAVDLKNGNAVDGVKDELNNLVNRISPTL